MKSRKYPTLESAITELEKIGKLQYWGRIDADTSLYTYIIGGVNGRESGDKGVKIDEV